MGPCFSSTTLAAPPCHFPVGEHQPTFERNYQRAKNFQHLHLLKLLTWNCCRGSFETKPPLVDHFNADISVFQEVSKPKVARANVLWFGKNPKIGMAIQARTPYSIKPLPALDGVPEYIVPIQVNGPQNFTLFAVWTKNDKALPYIRSLSTALDRYVDLLCQGAPVVVMGDFNSNAIWDKQHPKHLNHSSMVDRLDSVGLVSAYHQHSSFRHGEESDSTFYLYRKQEKGHHIDYCFLPKEWAGAISRVWIGTFQEFEAVSDHRPLIVEISQAA